MDMQIGTRHHEAARGLGRRQLALLLLGVVLIVLANMSGGVAVIGWFAPIPWLRVLRETRGARARLGFGVALAVAWVLTTAKIVTAPLPPALALVGLVTALVQLPAFLGADLVRRRLGEVSGALAFAALMVVTDGLQHRFTGLATWGAAAYTQLDDAPLMQLASVTGMAGVTFVVSFVGASLEALLGVPTHSTTSAKSTRRMALSSLALAALAHVFGAVRLSRGLAEGPSVRVAAIGTDATFDGSATPTDETRAATLEGLLADTRRAAHDGAMLAVWTEAAAWVPPSEEEAFVARVRAVAAQARIAIVAAYVVPLAGPSLRYENKYRWISREGAVDHVYFKHHPAPGEPMVVGEGPLGVVTTPEARMGGALCYDYDYPLLAAEHGAHDVAIVALPSSDWRGIDPIHTQMAGVRAIEQGVSIVRSTRFGLSAGIDPLGRVRAQRSSFERAADEPRVMLVELPRASIVTIYRRIGDVGFWASAAACLVLGVAIVGRGLRSSRSVRREAAATIESVRERVEA